MAYRLIIHVADGGPVQSVTINIGGPSEALVVAQRYSGTAELWHDNRMLCTLRQTPKGVWIISK